jgi:serine protease
MKKLLSLFILLCLLSPVSGQTAHPDYVDGLVYVKLSKAAMKALNAEDPEHIPLQKIPQLKGLIHKYGLTRAWRPFYRASDDEKLPCILKLAFSQAGSIPSLMRELSATEGIEFVEKVALLKTDATLPNDFAISSASLHLAQIGAPDAWDYFNGHSNITVAIVDNAVMWSHADLIANTYTNTIEANGLPGVDDDNNGYIDDIHGFDVAHNDNDPQPLNLGQDHGTHCAGIAGATTDNSTGIASIGWNIRIIPVKCSFDNSASTIVNLGYEGIIYAVRAGARIISCSWGNQTAPSQAEQLCIDYAWNRGAIIIASAGNSGNTTPNYPGAYNHVYCVAAVNGDDSKWGGSNYGTWVDISAPGNSILSTVPYNTTPAYQPYSGTSMATPMVAGLAALMLSKSPGMTRDNVLNCLSSTAANIYTLGTNAFYASGSQLGAGRIDAHAAMICAATYSMMAPVANFYAVQPNICPNTPLTFIDSSLYQPSSWSWTFQGGTPATSTASNPSVQWSSPGVYSVALTVSNANGSHTRTRLSYVTVAGPSPLPFAEGFEGNAFLPPGWSANNLWNDNIYWQRATGLGGFGSSTACAVFDNYDMNAPGEHDEMRSPRFDFSQVAAAWLRFDVAYARYNATYSDTLQLKISTDCGLSWTSIYLKGGSQLATAPDQGSKFVPSALQWRKDSVDVSLITAGQGQVMFSVLNRGHYGQPIYLDNINLRFPPPSLSIPGSHTACAGPQAYTFSNTSTGAGSYTWTFQGGAPASSTLSQPSVTYSSPGTYTLQLLGANGTTTASLTETITVAALPSLSISVLPSATLCTGSNATLQALGAGSYSWSSGGTGSTAVISPSGSATYTLYGSNAGCQTTETVSLLLTPASFSLSVSAQPASVCPGSSSTLSAQGAGSYTWSSGQQSGSLVVSPLATTQYSLSGSDGTCTQNTVITLPVLPLPVSVLSVTASLCHNSCDGRLDASSSGGSPPYTYSLSGQNCSTLPCQQLCPGPYTLFTTDFQGCFSATSFSVPAPQALVAVVSTTHTGCQGCQTGEISLSPSGGLPPYSYSWTPSVSGSESATGLPAGCYSVSIADAAGCTTHTSACVLFITGLSQHTAGGTLLQVYPNPAGEQVTILLENTAFRYSLYNGLGQLITGPRQAQHSVQLSLSGLPKGVYILEAAYHAGTLRKKLVLE